MADLKGSDFIEDGFLDKQIADMIKFKNVTVDSLSSIQKEAETMQESLKGASQAQKSGQKIIEDSEKRTDDLIKAQRKYTQSLDETEQEIVKLKAAQQEQNRINKLTEKLNRSSEGSYDKLSAQYSINKIKLNGMSEEQRKSTKSGKELELKTKDIYQEMKSLQEATGKNTLSVGDYAGKIGELVPTLGSAANGVKALGVQLWALVANPVGAIIAAVVVAVVGLWQAFKQTVGGAELLDKIMSSLSATFSTVLGRLGDFIQGEISFKELIFETGDAIKENIAATNSLVDARRSLARATAESEFAEANLEKAIASLQGVRDSDAKSLSQRRNAAIEVAKVERMAAQEQVNRAKLNEDIANREFEIARRAGKTSEAARTARTELTKALTETAKAEANLMRVQADSANQLEMIRLDIFDQELDLLLDITDRQKSVNERRIADDSYTLEQKRLMLDENVRIIEDAFDKQIKAFEELNGVQVDEQKLLQMTGSEILVYADRLGFSERAVNRLREVVIEKLAADQDNLESQKAINDQEDKYVQDSIKRANETLANARNAEIKMAAMEKDFAFSEIDLLEATEAEKTRLRLAAERDRLQKVIDINKFMGGELTDLQIATMENAIKKIDNEMDALSNDSSRKDIYSIVGLNLDDEAKQSISNSVSVISNSLSQIGQARLDAANTIVEASQSELENAQAVFDEQVALREQGMASDVSAAQARLRNAKATNDKALAEQRKARKAQERLDTATQVTSLITASANIFKSLSGLGPIGIALGVAAIASMFAAFANSKIQAKKVSKFGSGGEFDITGGSHSSGNDVSLGIHGGIERRVEGGERAAIFSKSSVNRYGGAISDVVSSFNDGTFDAKYSNAFVPSAKMPSYMIRKAGVDSADLKEIISSENQAMRNHINASERTNPQTIWNVGKRGLRKDKKIGDSIYRDVENENEW